MHCEKWHSGAALRSRICLPVEEDGRPARDGLGLCPARHGCWEVVPRFARSLATWLDDKPVKAARGTEIKAWQFPKIALETPFLIAYHRNAFR